MASDTEITKVRIVIRHLLWQIREVRNDRDAAWKWVNRFANTLQYQELEQDPDQYALAILAEARSFNDQQRRKGQMLGVRKQLAKEGVTSPTQEQLDEKWLEMYGQENSPQDAPNGNAGVDRKSAESTDEKCGSEKPNSQKSPQPSLFPVAKPEKRRYGKYRHVLLTDDEGRKLRESLGEDLEDAVAILDEYIQQLPVKAKGAKKNGAKWWMQEYEAKDHYIVLHHGWARKRLNEMRTEELNARAAELRFSAAETNAKAAEKRLENANSSSQPRQMYLTSDDISRRNAEEGWRQLQLMHQMEGNG